MGKSRWCRLVALAPFVMTITAACGHKDGPSPIAEAAPLATIVVQPADAPLEAVNQDTV